MRRRRARWMVSEKTYLPSDCICELSGGKKLPLQNKD